MRAMCLLPVLATLVLLSVVHSQAAPTIIASSTTPTEYDQARGV